MHFSFPVNRAETVHDADLNVATAVILSLLISVSLEGG